MRGVRPYVRPSVRLHLDLRDGWTDLLETWYPNNLIPANDARIFKILISFKLADWRPFLFGKGDCIFTLALYVSALFSKMG